MAIVLRSNKAIKEIPQLARVVEFKRRVLEDGGEIINEAAISAGYSFLERVGLGDNNLISFASPEFAVKKDEAGKVFAVYSLVGGSGSDLVNSQENKASLVTVNGKTRLSFLDGMDKQTYALRNSPNLAPAEGIQSIFYGGNYTQKNKTLSVTLGHILIGDWTLSTWNSITTSVEVTGFNYKKSYSEKVYEVNDESGIPLTSFLCVSGTADGYLYKNGKLTEEAKPKGEVIMVAPALVRFYAMGGSDRRAVPSGYLGLVVSGYNLNREQQLLLAEYIENYG